MNTTTATAPATSSSRLVAVALETTPDYTAHGAQALRYRHEAVLFPEVGVLVHRSLRGVLGTDSESWTVRVSEVRPSMDSHSTWGSEGSVFVLPEAFASARWGDITSRRSSLAADALPALSDERIAAHAAERAEWRATAEAFVLEAGWDPADLW